MCSGVCGTVTNRNLLSLCVRGSLKWHHGMSIPLLLQKFTRFTNLVGKPNDCDSWLCDEDMFGFPNDPKPCVSGVGFTLTFAVCKQTLPCVSFPRSSWWAVCTWARSPWSAAARPWRSPVPSSTPRLSPAAGSKACSSCSSPSPAATK